MSSFKRSTKSTVVIPPGGESEPSFTAHKQDFPLSGSKPWVSSGLGIVSTGNKQLDELIGGGNALGTLTILECDGFSNYGETMMLYNLAEAVSHKHSVMLLAEDENEASRIISTLPYNQTIGATDPVHASDNMYHDESLTDNSSHLTIAWQYSKYMKSDNQSSRSALVTRVSQEGRVSPTYCCSYDLSRRLQDSLLSESIVELCLADRASVDGGVAACLNRMVEAVATFLRLRAQEKNISRIVISGLDQIFNSVSRKTGSAVCSWSAARFILDLKHVIRTSRVSLLITMNPSATSPGAIRRIHQMADTLLSVESFAGRSHSVPYEFKDFQGFLVVHRIQNYGSMAPFRPPGTRFGLKRDRRKLHIEPLHLPPEESRAFSTTGGAATASAPTLGNVNLGSAAVGSAPGIPIDGTISNHTYDHKHVHTADCHHSSSASPSSSSLLAAAPAGSPASASVSAAPIALTPLQASLAALKAARQQQSAATSNSNSVGSAFAPVTIHRAPNSTVPAPTSVRQNNNDNNKAPLQPGQACNSHASGVGGAKTSYDF